MMYAREENNYPKAVAISLAIMAAFLVVAFFYVIGTPFLPEQEGTGGVIVNYGTAEEGIGTDYMSIEEPSQHPDANNTPPDKVVPNTDPKTTPSAETSDKEVVTQDNEEAPSVVTKDKKSANAPSVTPDKKDSKPVINPNALYKGSQNNATGKGDGTGSKPGNQGSVNGDPLSADYGEGGSGFGNKPIEYRHFTNLVIPKDDGQKTGKIVIRIYFDRSGKILSAKQELKGSTLTDINLVNKCIQAVLDASLSPGDVGGTQTGVVVFNFKVK
ncbi:energy transducer TonB [Pedobacter sp. BS3]|uniref:energy transducer TonB n=1 Tax=Pedobacter sp. BS3 TaxID=2567937 RepID=UPI0011EE0E6C|nr:energy transducer TonB [Pedobacter sp. BS3]TZF84695.1 energy transducer TonB [Pedobacter sp. BS3]